MRLVQYNDIINKYVFNGKIDKYNNMFVDLKTRRDNVLDYRGETENSDVTQNVFDTTHFTFNNVDDVSKFINYYKFKNHDFGDLALGDEIIINDGKYNKHWIIAGFNTQLDTNENKGTYGKEHITLIPKNSLFTSAVNDGSEIKCGYIHSYMFKTVMPSIDNNLTRVLDKHLLFNSVRVSTKVHDDIVLVNKNVKSTLMNHYQAFGSPLQCCSYKPYSYKPANLYITRMQNINSKTDDVLQLPLFYQCYRYRVIFEYVWLRDTDMNYRYLVIGGSGDIDYSSIKGIYGVRPLIFLG